MTASVSIIDYGMGNLASVARAFRHLGCEVEIVDTPAGVSRGRILILPGVGAFPDAVDHLAKSGISEAIKNASRKGTPLLGICLGMQLLFDRGTEKGECAGLGLLEGSVVRFPQGHPLKVPHMGWNQLWPSKERRHRLFDGVKDGDYVYFVHSYFPDPNAPDVVLATTDYGLSFPSVVGRGRTFGIQFHPEKSQNVGLRILENFLRVATDQEPAG